jgi:hypothetical protein
MPRKKKETIEVLHEDPSAIIINGKKYRLAKEKIRVMDHHLHGDKVIFEPVDEERFEKDVDFIVKNVEHVVDKKEILKEIIKQMPLSNIKKMKKLIEQGKPVKKTSGCVCITVGDDSKGAVISIA